MKYSFARYAAVAFSAFYIGQHSASAALTWAVGDVFVGFREADNTVSDYLINIGPQSAFRDATAPVVRSFGAALNSDLIAAFGSDWATDTDITWGFIGANSNAGTLNTGLMSDPGRTFYISQPVGTVPQALSSQSGVTSKYLDVKNDWLSQTEATVPNSSIGSPSDANSWTMQATEGFSIQALVPMEGSTSGSLDFYRVPQTTTSQQVTLEGTFTFNAINRTITFNPVPEPSAVMLFISSTVATVGFFRRRKLVS